MKEKGRQSSGGNFKSKLTPFLFDTLQCGDVIRFIWCNTSRWETWLSLRCFFKYLVKYLALCLKWCASKFSIHMRLEIFIWKSIEKLQKRQNEFRDFDFQTFSNSLFCIAISPAIIGFEAIKQLCSNLWRFSFLLFPRPCAAQMVIKASCGDVQWSREEKWPY